MRPRIAFEMKTALITGANKGIGHEVARQLAAKGFQAFVGADTIVWLASEAPHDLTGKFLRDRKELPW